MMKRLFVMAAAVPVLSLVAAAQDEPQQHMAKMKAELDAVMGQMKVVGLSGAAMGATVKGAPYSAIEVTENNQTLADGTRIHNENQTNVYRDSEGRVRRETPNQITILDPVANVSYFLNPKTMTATKSTLLLPAVFKKAAAGGMGGVGGVGAGGGSAVEGGGRFLTTGENTSFHVSVSKEGTASVTVSGNAADPSSVAFERTFTVNGQPVDEQTFSIAQDKVKAEKAFAAGADGVLRRQITNPGKTESLGTQMMEGVNAEGTRLSTTLDTGAIGNDRPIQMINERWYSPDLKTIVMTRHSDPRSGEDVFRLTNISRTEPGADLFQVPPSYQLIDRK
ncbi:MAG TPA: hypothetical protein VKU19_03115 [Bryobacteraceae bacterium]|nr:hypothetical protein [Bryobacteraceae bacterium]